MNPEQSWLEWASTNAAAISIVINVIVIPALVLLLQRLAAWGVVKAETAKAMAEGIEATKAEDTKAWIATTATQLDKAVKESIAENAAHADPSKPNPKGAMWLRVALGVLQRTDVIGMVTKRLRGAA